MISGSFWEEPERTYLYLRSREAVAVREQMDYATIEGTCNGELAFVCFILRRIHVEHPFFFTMAQKVALFLAQKEEGRKTPKGINAPRRGKTITSEKSTINNEESFADWPSKVIAPRSGIVGLSLEVAYGISQSL